MRSRVILLLLSAIAVMMFIDQREELFEDKGRLEVVRVGASDRTVLLRWTGDVELPMARRFAEAFDEWRDKADRFVIELKSPGGSLYEGRQVVELIDRMKQTRQVDTYVASHGYCLSMCVPIYLQGERRTAAASSRWMFHQPYTADFFTGEKTGQPESERRAMADRFFERYFLGADINPAWRDRLRQEWQGEDVWRTGAELVAEKAGIVQELE